MDGGDVKPSWNDLWRFGLLPGNPFRTTRHPGLAPHVQVAKVLRAAVHDVMNRTAPNLTGVRVLLVDDERDIREFLSVALAQFGAEVKAAASSREAMETLERFHPDVLVSDLVMRDEDGYYLIRRVRALPPEQGGRVPAVAVTGFSGPSRRSRALWVGFQRVMTKPVDPEELAAVVARLTEPFEEDEVLMA
jgi:CheY-like chemotaxis protein